MTYCFEKISLLAALLSVGCATQLRVKEAPFRLEAHLEIEADTIALGQPFYADFILQNKSGIQLYIEEGGDYRGGRLERFNVQVVSSENDTLERKWSFGGGGMIGFRPFGTDSVKRYEHFIPAWCDITEPGTYTIHASKKFRLAKEAPADYLDLKEEVWIEKGASKSVVVIRDPVRIQRYTEDLATQIKAETKGRIADLNGFEKGKGVYRSLSPQLSKNLRKIDHVNDENIVPFLVECYERNENIPRYKSVYNLARFSKHPQAYQVLLAAAQGEHTSTSFVSPDSISPVRSITDMRQEALIGILQADTEESLRYLMNKKNDAFPDERYMLLMWARHTLPGDQAKKLYLAYSDDQHKVVRNKAKALLEGRE